MKYHIWTYGCQMNTADSRRLASEMEKIGHSAAKDPDEADILIVNTCVVRQSAENKAYGRLGMMAHEKRQNPGKILALMGCLVGVRNPAAIQERFPFVDVVLKPSEPEPLIDFLIARESGPQRAEMGEGELILPSYERGLVSAEVPVVLGCSHACAYCIIPYRRGVERSREPAKILDEVKSLAAQGVKEVTLLGQIVDRYGLDLDADVRLADLLRMVHAVEGLARIRFLTSHPSFITDALLDAVAELPKVCEHIEVPVQAGDDDVLARMRRGYTADTYRRLIEKIRARVPGVSITTDVIVGFPGETAAQFGRTVELLEETRPDKIHIAKYSPRPQTLSARTMPDDVTDEEKERRRLALEDLHRTLSSEINAALMDQTVEVLVEGKKKGRWFGRTRNNKLVFFESENVQYGERVPITVQHAGPWSLQGKR